MSATTRTGVVITMAGLGSRFAEAGYRIPKYEIAARGRTLFAWSMESLRSFIAHGCPFVFIARAENGDLRRVRDFIAEECAALGIANYEVVTIDSPTDGQATTALLARQLWADVSDPVAIYNIDTYVAPGAMDMADIRGAGWIPCFAGAGDKWSFAAADDEGVVTEVREKQRISPHATLGLYWFDSFARYVDAYRRYYSNPLRIEARERYIAPLYNQLIEDGARVCMQLVSADQVFPLGTPEDVRLFDALASNNVAAVGRV